MDQLIQLIIYVVIFAIVGYGLWWVCTKFALAAARHVDLRGDSADYHPAVREQATWGRSYGVDPA